MILQYISSERHTINVYKRPSEPGEIVVLSTADLKKILLPPEKLWHLVGTWYLMSSVVGTAIGKMIIG